MIINMVVCHPFFFPFSACQRWFICSEVWTVPYGCLCCWWYCAVFLFHWLSTKLSELWHCSVVEAVALFDCVTEEGSGCSMLWVVVVGLIWQGIVTDLLSSCVGNLVHLGLLDVLIVVMWLLGFVFFLWNDVIRQRASYLPNNQQPQACSVSCLCHLGPKALMIFLGRTGSWKSGPTATRQHSFPASKENNGISSQVRVIAALKDIMCTGLWILKHTEEQHKKSLKVHSTKDSVLCRILTILDNETVLWQCSMK